MTPEQKARMKAQIDWTEVGEFNSDNLSGDSKKAYDDEASKIQRQWDNKEL